MVIYMYSKLQEYLIRNPESYLGYYVKGLIILDSYLEDTGKLPFSVIESIESFKKAYELSRGDKILKYYFAALLLGGDIGKIVNFEKALKVPIGDIKFKLIKEILPSVPQIGFIARVHLADYEYFDGEDYLILYILKKRYKIEILKGKNLLLESYLKGRKSKGIINAMFKESVAIEDLSPEILRLYVKFSNKFIDKNLLANILKKNLLNMVDESNLNMIENIICTFFEDRICKKIVDKYVSYCLFSSHFNDEVLEVLLKRLEDYFSPETVTLLLYKDFELGEKLKARTIKALKEKCHFSRVEAELLTKLLDPLLKVQADHLYKININVPIRKVKVLINMSFPGYGWNENFEYFDGVDNYYFLPEPPLNIKLLFQGKIIECKQTDFCCQKEEIAEKVEDSNALSEYVSEVSFKNTYERFFLFILFTSSCFQTVYSDNIINILMKNNHIFRRELYLKILLTAQRANSKASKNAVSIINTEILKLDLNPEILHDVIVSEENIDRIIDIMFMAKQSDLKIYIRTYLHLFNKAAEMNYYSMNLCFLCEDFIAKYSLINDVLYMILEVCYRKYSIITERTLQIAKVMELYVEDNLYAQKLILQIKCLQGNFNYEFYNVFIKAYSALSIENDLIKDCINAIIHSENYYFDKQYLQIFKEMYLSDTSNMLLLEEYIIKSIDYGVHIEPEYLVNLSSFFIKKNLINSRTQKILMYMYNNGQSSILSFLAESLKYEMINVDLSKNSDVYYKVYFGDELKKIEIVPGINEYPAYMGYSYGYYLSDPTDVTKFYQMPRRLIQNNINFFIESYDIIKDKDFKDFISSHCAKNYILKENILQDYMDCGAVNGYLVGLFLINSFIDVDSKKTAMYLKNYLNLFRSSDATSRLKRCMEVLIKTKLQKTKDLMAEIKNSEGNELLEEIAIRIIEASLTAGKYKEIPKLFLLNNGQWNNMKCQNMILKYIKTVDKINEENSEFFSILFSVFNNTDFGDKIILSSRTVLEYFENLEQYREKNSTLLNENNQNEIVRDNSYEENELKKYTKESAKSDSKSFEPKKAILQFENLNDDEKKTVINYVIAEDIYKENIYKYMLNNYDYIQPHIEYLMNYYSEEDVVGKQLWKVLQSYKMEDVKIGKKIKDLIISFLRSVIKNRYVVKEEVLQYIESGPLFSDIEIESLSKALSLL